jgi:hypothetical protein
MLLLPMIMLLMTVDDDASADDYGFYCGCLYPSMRLQAFNSDYLGEQTASQHTAAASVYSLPRRGCCLEP